ncbi:hypothetical protein FZW96_13985 [Bacillus sp. BGMRC 2118]|nr:hypothetical protein FZW96_13985 [Bacillus sp. BGMRC 2118]
MKPILLCIFGLLLFTACQHESAPYEKLLSKEEGTLSILVVSDELDTLLGEELVDTGIERLVTTIHETTTLDLDQNEYGLELEKKPAFIVFTNKKKIFTTYSKHELLIFLKEYKK